MVKGLAAALVAALAVLGARQASATTVAVTYTGTVSTGTDSAGVFGTAGADLAGTGYRLVFSIDTNVGNYSTFNGTIADPALSGDQVFGGMSAVLTINGVAYSFDGTAVTSGNYDIVAHKPGIGEVVQQVGSASGYAFASFQSTSPGSGFPTSVLSNASLASCPAGTCLASLNFAITGAGGGTTVAFLNFGSFTSTVATAPIPATLPLLVSALGGIGLIGWRSKRARAV
jgi:hypothetical protein